MTKTSLPVVFFGSGPVAAASLRLLNNNFTIESVVTKPRAAHHKGSVPVIEAAEELGLPVHTVVNKRTLDELIASKPFTSTLAILIDFGIIVSQTAIDYFPLGIINSHFSLLPQWRGADPITFSILSGQKETGVSLMLLTAGMDEGPILAYGAYPLPPRITTPELTHDLIELSDVLLQEVVPAYASGSIIAKPQDNVADATYSRKLTKEDGAIDWSKPADQIEREIRAFIEWPKSSTTLAKHDVVITAAHVLEASGEPGNAVKLSKQLVVYCGKDALIIDSLKPAGKKEMTGQAFLAGYGNLL
ncbi:MAG TPA: methionyl-tRNA formyltransferase [Candidatus Saccharimonadales bacterium]|nr:methionyl-tRNA formyltransferase [Candidatus Saccharimonadales bacterium]